MKQEEFIIFLTGGSTGGHFFPLLFVAREIKRIAQEKNLNLRVFYLGSKPLNKELLENEDVKVYIIPEVKLRKYLSLKNFIDFVKFPFSFSLAFFYLFKYLPDLIFSKGGPGSLPVVLAGYILRIPIIIHESDSYPGITNRLSGFLAKKVYLAFEEASKFFSTKKVKVVGQPIDYYLIKEPAIIEDYQRYNLDPHRKIIFVLGGSQGSKFLNELIVHSLPQLLNLAQVIHQTGYENFKDTYNYALGILSTKSPDKIKDYHPYPFLPNEDVILLMKISDLIVSRAGASSIFEIAAVGKPSILIPIGEKIAGKHQLLNAEIYVNAGAAWFLDETNLKPNLLLVTVKKIFEDRHLREKMETSAKKFAKVESAEIIAQDSIDYILNKNKK